MSAYTYWAVDPEGIETKGILDAADQEDALKRIKDMGYFPTCVRATTEKKSPSTTKSATRAGARKAQAGGIKAKQITAFTRQLATLIEAGLPLLRSLSLLREQERQRGFKNLLGEIALSIEGGSTFSEALAQHPKVFSRLYVNMIRAGEVSGALDVALRRLAEFMERAQKIRGKVTTAMFYPAAVVMVAIGVMAILTIFVLPKFKEVFAGLLGADKMPKFTLFVFGVSDTVTQHIFWLAGCAAGLVVLWLMTIRTPAGRRFYDGLKFRAPLLGPIFRKLAISRFTRTLGTLIMNGVPILQALTIVREVSGNVLMAATVSGVRKNVEEGESMTAPLRASGIFPPTVVGMIDVGEQTGALPEMLTRIADNYDEEVDNSVWAMTSVLEPILIVLLAVVVGSIVVAMFLPLIILIDGPGFGGQGGGAM